MRAPQRIAEAIGKDGCYFLSLLYLAERQMGSRIDPLEAYELAVAKGFLKADCFVMNPSAILELYIPGTWTVFHEKPDYRPGSGELEILRFERGEGAEAAAHFVVGDGQGRVAFDPYGESRTVREGRLASKRIARRTA